MKKLLKSTKLLFLIKNFYEKTNCVVYFRVPEEEIITNPVEEYWSPAPHPQLAHLPQLPHPLIGQNLVVRPNQHLPHLPQLVVPKTKKNPAKIKLVKNPFKKLPKKPKIKKEPSTTPKKQETQTGFCC